jgi:hypothetical protein
MPHSPPKRIPVKEISFTLRLGAARTKPVAATYDGAVEKRSQIRPNAQLGDNPRFRFH